MRSYTIKTNKRKLTGTITEKEDGKVIGKYRIYLSKGEVLEAEYWTSNDISNYLKHNDATVLR